MKKPIAVVADDQSDFLSIVVRLLQAEFEIAAAVGDGAALISSVEEHDPDVVVADISMPLMSGVEAVAAMSSKSPFRPAGDLRAVVLLTNHQDQGLVERALEAGALGYVLKPRAALDLLLAIDAARQGRVFVSPPLEIPSTAAR